MTLTIQDRLDLHQVINLYGHVVDGRWDLADLVFCADVELDATASGIPVLNGRDAVAADIGGRKTGPQTHMVTNIAIIEVVDDDTVRMASKWVFGGPFEYLTFGDYEDELVRTSEGWRIKHRRLIRLFAFKGLAAVTDGPMFE